MEKHLTGRCDHCQGERETVEHIIFQCKQYGREREKLLLELSNGVEELILSELLGKSSGDVQYLCICFLWEMRILGRI